MLQSLPPEHTLLDALSALIEGASRGKFFRISAGGGIPEKDDALFEMKFNGPVQTAQIVVNGSIGTRNSEAQARIVYGDQGAMDKGRNRKPTNRPDLTQSRSISYSTIRQLGDLISKAGD